MNTYSMIWLGAFCCAVVLYALGLYFKKDYSNWETALYLPAYLLGRLLWRVHFLNNPPEEIKGGAILAANHRSSLDPMFVQLAARRRVHWMVAKEFCQNAVLGVFLRALEVIPTNRTGTDINSTKIAMKYAAQGRLVGMFPEGKINLGSELLLPVRAGAAMVAVKTGVPIIPLYIKGSPYRGTALSPLLMPARVQIVFGKPIYAETRSRTSESDSSDSSQDGRRSSHNPRTNGNQQAAELIAGWGQEIAKLAGQPGFQVQVGSSTRHRNTARASVNSPTISSDQ